MTETRTSFDLENPYLAEFLDQQALQLAGGVSDTTTLYLKATLDDGIRNGEGVPKLRQRIQDVFQDATRKRATLIARTEANKGANGASWLQATSSGVVKTKSWLATGDARTRPEHRALHGETVPINETFSNGLMFPSEPNCRCTLTYGIDESKLKEPVEDDPFAEDFEAEPVSAEAARQARYEAKLIKELAKAERSRVYNIIQEAGGLKTNAALREEYAGIPNTFKRTDGLAGDEMAEYLSVYYPELGITDERDLIDFLAGD